MAPSDSRSVNCYGHGHLVCKFPINVTVPFHPLDWQLASPHWFGARVLWRRASLFSKNKRPPSASSNDLGNMRSFAVTCEVCHFVFRTRATCEPRKSPATSFRKRGKSREETPKKGSYFMHGTCQANRMQAGLGGGEVTVKQALRTLPDRLPITMCCSRGRSAPPSKVTAVLRGLRQPADRLSVQSRR